LSNLSTIDNYAVKYNFVLIVGLVYFIDNYAEEYDFVLIVGDVYNIIDKLASEYNVSTTSE